MLDLVRCLATLFFLANGPIGDVAAAGQREAREGARIGKPLGDLLVPLRAVIGSLGNVPDQVSRFVELGVLDAVEAASTALAIGRAARQWAVVSRRNSARRQRTAQLGIV